MENYGKLSLDNSGDVEQWYIGYMWNYPRRIVENKADKLDDVTGTIEVELGIFCGSVEERKQYIREQVADYINGMKKE